MTGWRDGLGPWQPVLTDGKLYGRGGADDGYAVFASLAAIGALQAQGVAHARCVGVIETCEESGSYDLPAYLELLAPRMGAVDFVVGLDSGCGDYERLWATTSLRGLAGGTLNVDVLTEGVHSGDASGVVPSSFRIARAVARPPRGQRDGARTAAGSSMRRSRRSASGRRRRPRQSWATRRYASIRLRTGTQPMIADHAEALLNRTWRPALSVTGADGFPAIADAGNVLRPTNFAQALAAPAAIGGCGRGARRRCGQLLESDPPHGASVRFDSDEGATGWNAPPTAPWLEARAATRRRRPSTASRRPRWARAAPFRSWRCWASIFPRAQFLITGVLGPKSNAHGPNEFLHIPYATKLTACVATVLAAHAAREGRYAERLVSSPRASLAGARRSTSCLPRARACV